MSTSEIIMANNFNQAPLPFVGQKRFFLKHFISVLQEAIPDKGSGWTIVDVFGGSGLLAHHAKKTRPAARVIYNDFDGYTERLKHIDDTNQLRRKLAELTADIPRYQRLSESKKNEVINIIRSFKGFIDIRVLNTWLMFGTKQESSIDRIFQQCMYNCIRTSDYPDVRGYLNGVDIVSESFSILMPKYVHNAKTLFILDPPYVSTMQGSYKQSGYFGMIEFLKLMELVRPPFIFFSSTRSEFIEYLKFLIDGKCNHYERFTDYKRISISANMSKNVSYEDNMIYKI